MNPGALRPTLQKILAKTDQVQRRIRHWGAQLFPPAGSQDLFSNPSQEGVYAEHARGVSGLSPKELETFQREGWIGPFPFLTAKGIKAA